ncbi:DivIVA domain-containing protein [Agrococcus sp. TSP3-2-1]|uniref:DivIVA domain-containing protein n=1 Tax=Agrococcus sp. TSP3-2-1 TaxID=2804583 RepID=UPI003CF5F75B
MALTPDDVVHKRFETTRFRDGYDQDEVDDFLDEVVTELRRLIEENDGLRAENEQLRQGIAPAEPAPAAEVDTAELDALRAENEQLKQQLAERDAAPVEQAEPVAAGEPDTAELDALRAENEQLKQQLAEQQESAAQSAPEPAAEASSPVQTEANSLIVLAQRLHDEHVAEGERKRDELIAAAEQTAQQIEEAAEERKSLLEQEFDQTKARLDEQKGLLEQKIDELKSFERDYRLKLRGYIESQLRDLDRSSSLAFGGQGGS